MLTSLELFAGAGGLALGTHAAGFRHIALVEKDAFAVETLRENSRRVLDLDPNLVIHQDARTVDYSVYLGKVDLLSGGPPCQPFSTAGRNLGHADTRNMFPVFFDAVASIMPKAILIENVKGLCRSIFSDYFNYILKRVQFPLLRIQDDESWQDHYARLMLTTTADFNDDEQFVAHYQIVDAANYGVPQRRERVLIFAFRRDLGIIPFHIEPTHSKKALFLDQWITGDYWDRHGLPSQDYLGPSDRKYLARMQSSLLFEDSARPWRTVRDALSDLPEPVQRGSEATFLNHIQHPGARIYPSHIGSFHDYPSMNVPR